LVRRNQHLAGCLRHCLELVWLERSRSLSYKLGQRVGVSKMPGLFQILAQFAPLVVSQIGHRLMGDGLVHAASLRIFN